MFLDLCRTQGGGGAPFAGLEHRVVFAVATSSTVLLYDTQQLAPFGGLANLHYAAISDIAWSGDGRVLVLSSEDGFCSMVTFAPGQLGKPIPSESPPVLTFVIALSSFHFVLLFVPLSSTL